jgi:hypothetical protein
VGGAIAVRDTSRTLTITSSQFTENLARLTTSSTSPAPYATAGAVYIREAGALIVGSRFDNNSARCWASPSVNTQACNAYGGVIDFTNPTLQTVNSSTFVGNSARSTHNAYGGAFKASAGSAGTTLGNCTFRLNFALASGPKAAEAAGGAIWAKYDTVQWDVNLVNTVGTPRGTCSDSADGRELLVLSACALGSTAYCWGPLLTA